MGDSRLDDLRTTAQRVKRFAREVEQRPSDQSRLLFRAGLTDLQQAVRDALAAGWDPSTIQSATGSVPTESMLAESADTKPAG